ncbi:MAG TPA: sulfatase, partial [Roseimicrobium sp.]|nr:sulfatase [Roseimicrobium sp.]
DFHVAQPVCSASRAALLTGCYPNRLGIHGALSPKVTHGLNTNEMTLAKLVKQKGYATGMVWKWHLGHLPEFMPNRQGFDDYLGLPYSNDMWPLHPEAKPGTYPPLPLYDNGKIVDPDVGHEKQSQLTTLYTERAVRFIDQHKDAPFFLYVAHSMPHVPLHVSDKFKGKSQRGLYGDVIMEIDWSVGEILGALKRHGLDDNTLVIFTSDNGPWLSYGNHAGSAEPLKEGKGTSWEGGTRVPFIARWTGSIPANQVVKEMAMSIDLFPTIAKLTGSKLPANRIDGRDMWPLLSGQKNARSPQEAYFFYYENNQLQAVRSGPWKLILPHTYRTLGGKLGGTNGIPAKYQQAKAELELYDVSRDVGETSNLAALNLDVVKRLYGFAETARHDLGDSLTQQKGSGVREAGKSASGADSK